MKDWPIRRCEEKLDKIIQQRFSGACMSNRKWVKLIEKLVEHAPLIKKCQIKLIWEDQVWRELLIDEHTAYQFDYYESSMESMISGSPHGWYSYKEIEWIVFPKRSLDVPDEQPQDLEKIYQIVNSIGDLCVEIDEEELKIYGYK